MNKRNYAQRSNYMCGTDTLDLLPFYVQTLNLPGMNFGLPEIGGRTGVKLHMTSDTVTFTSLSMEILIDEDYQIYKDIAGLITKHMNVETGSYADFFFDFWIAVTDDMGRVVMKIEYYNCRIESIGDLSLDSQDDTTEQTLPLELMFDYFKISDTGNMPTLSI